MDKETREIVEKVQKRFGVSIDEKKVSVAYLEGILQGKYSKIEALNIIRRGNPKKFSKSELGIVSNSELRRLAQKYINRPIPGKISRNSLELMITGKCTASKLSERELEAIGNLEGSSIGAVANFIKGGKGEMRKKRVELGKRRASYYNNK